MTFPAIFAIVVGVGMLGQWSVSYFAGAIPELETEPYRIAFHLAGECLTALMLISSGLGLLLGLGWAPPLFLVAAGMLLYTAVVSPGYFIQQGQPAWLLLFGTILLVTVLSLALIIRTGF